MFKISTNSVLICSEGDTIAAKTDTVEKVTELEIGDVNCDGCINVEDVTMIQRLLAEFDVEINSFLADTTGDGSVNIKDVTQLQRYLAEIITQLG